MWCRFSLFVLIFSIMPIADATETGSPPTAEPVKPGEMSQVARRIEPDLAGKPERLAQYIQYFSRELGNDSRLCAFRVAADVVQGREVRLIGYVEFPETRNSLKAFLAALGFHADDRIDLLPAESLGEKRFGLVAEPHTYVFDRPSGKRKQENELLIGEPLLLLREQDGHLLVHSREGYLGYVSSSDVVRLDGAAYENYLTGPRVRVAEDLPGKTGISFPAGARLKWVGNDGEDVKLETPQGHVIRLPAKQCRVCEVPEEKLDKIIATAKRFMGTPYFWGGRTSEGIDCSGLVQMSYAAAGFYLPRDAYQQFYMGQLTATRWHRAGLRKGDTLYFLAADGKIRHTGIYLGEGRYLQAAMPKARISSLNPGDPDYDAGHSAGFAFAKRLVD